MTAQFAPVAPLGLLRTLAEAHLLGHYQLLIAPVVLNREPEYERFFEDHNDQTIIMDNGVIEHGYAVNPQTLAEACRVVKANVAVLPDTIDDMKMTMKQVRYAIAAFRLYDHVTDTMGVVQGTTFEECIECARSHVTAGVDWLAVPRGLTPNLGSRVRLVQTLATEFGLPIHVLGFSDNVADDIAAAACHQSVMGIDAATPSWVNEWLPLHPPAQRNVSLSWGKRPEDFWTNPGAVSMKAAHNIETARRWLNVATTARTEREGLAARQDPPTRSS